VNKKIDLTDIIVSDIKDKKNPTLKLFLIVGILIFSTIFYFSFLKNKTIEKKNIFSQKKEIIINNNLKKEMLPIYFIQVSVFNKNKHLNKNLLKKIKDNNLSFKVKKVNKFKKVLIGPYYGYSSAKKHLPLIQEKIEKTAFIKKKQ